jgi:hypothetical protein
LATGCTSITNEDEVTGERIYGEKLAAAGIHVISAKPGRFSLEDVFITIPAAAPPLLQRSLSPGW